MSRFWKWLTRSAKPEPSAYIRKTDDGCYAIRMIDADGRLYVFEVDDLLQACMELSFLFEDRRGFVPDPVDQAITLGAAYGIISNT